MFWLLYVDHMAYCDKYEKIDNETHEVMSLEDYINIKRRKELRDRTKTYLKGTRYK